MGQRIPPERQADLLAFMLNAAVLLVATPFKFGLTPQEAASFNAVVQDFNTKMLVISNPATKTKATVQAKNESRLAMLIIVRPLLQYIKDNAGVASDDKVALGLNVNGNTKIPVPAPSTMPVVQIVAATPRQHLLRFRDSIDATRRGKPPGVKLLELFCQIGDSPAVSIEYARFIKNVTRDTFVMNFAEGDIGKTAHYWTTWCNGKGDPGPCSVPVSGVIM